MSWRGAENEPEHKMFRQKQWAESTMISGEHNLQNSRLLSNFTAPGPSGPNLIWSKIIWEIGPTVMSYCFMIPIWSHVWVWGDSYRPSHWSRIWQNCFLLTKVQPEPRRPWSALIADLVDITLDRPDMMLRWWSDIEAVQMTDPSNDITRHLNSCGSH